MNRRTLLLGGVAAVAAVGGWWVTQGKQSLPDLGAANAQTADGAEIDTSGIVEMVLGADDAKVTVMEYASFTCPHCADFHETVFGELKKNYIDTGKIKFIYRDVYFDRFGLWASMVARCEPTKFFGISDMIYRQQKEWIAGGDPAMIADNLRKIGKVAGLGEDQLAACLDDNDNAQALVAWFQKNATADDINSTPSLVIDGEKFSNMSYADLSAILDKKIAEKS